MKPFSKLKKQIENLFDPELKMEFCCSAYPMRPKNGYATRSIPRFYVKLGKEIIWDYHKDFEVDSRSSEWCENNGISALVREYIDTPVDELLCKEFSGEYKHFGDIVTYRNDPKGEKVKFVLNKSDDNVVVSLTDLFRAADRRISNNKLLVWSNNVTNPAVLKVIGNRFSRWKSLIKKRFKHSLRL